MCDKQLSKLKECCICAFRSIKASLTRVNGVLWPAMTTHILKTSRCRRAFGEEKKKVPSTFHHGLLDDIIAIMLALIANSGQPVLTGNAGENLVEESWKERFKDFGK